MIACALAIGISKRELMEDYTLNEFQAVLGEWNRMHGGEDDTPETVSALDFLGGIEDGEIIGDDGRP